MTDERLILAIGRIERALSRLESRGLPAPVEGDLKTRFERLEERHRRLRARTAEAADQLGLLLDQPKAG